MNIRQSAENYLETIFMLKQRKGFVRSIDIANELGFSKASVSVAMKALRESGYVTVDSEGGVSLTDEGQKIADTMYERHELIANVLMFLGVSEETAYNDSCKIEHVISDETITRIKEFLDSKKDDFTV